MPETFHLVTITSSASLGGLERFQLRLAADLAGRGHRVEAIGAPGSPFCRGASAAGLEVHTRRFNSYLSPLAVIRLARLLRRLQPDLIHYRLSRNIWTIAPAARLAGLRGRVVHTLGMNPGGQLRNPVHRWLRETLGAFVAPAPATAAKAEQVWGMAPGEATVIPNYVANSPYSAPRVEEASAEWRAIWGVPEGATCIGTLARLEPAKGIDDVLTAAIEVAGREEGRETWFIIGGPPSPGHQDWLAAQRESLRSAPGGDRIIFTGAIEHERVPAFLKALDAFVLASHSETFGLVLVEAMLAGCVVIATRGPGPEFILDKGQGGILVPPRDRAALVTVLLDLLSGREEIWALGERGQAIARRRFTDEVVLDRYEELFRSLIAST